MQKEKYTSGKLLVTLITSNYFSLLFIGFKGHFATIWVLPPNAFYHHRANILFGRLDMIERNRTTSVSEDTASPHDPNFHT